MEQTYKMQSNFLLEKFMNKIYEDPRIKSSHISLFVSIVMDYYRQCGTNPIIIRLHSILTQAKISNSTFHRCIKELNDYGYIIYIPSFDPTRKSKIRLLFEE